MTNDRYTNVIPYTLYYTIRIYTKQYGLGLQGMQNTCTIVFVMFTCQITAANLYLFTDPYSVVIL